MNNSNNGKIQSQQQDHSITTTNDIVDVACACACVLIETSYGDLIIDLSIQTKEECLLVYNFLLLCYTRYYSNTLIHTIIPNRFVYCGDPSGTSIGGTSIYGLLDTKSSTSTSTSTSTKNNTTVSYLQSNQRFLKSTSVGTSISNDKKQSKGLLVATCINNIPDTIGSQFIITISSGVDHAFDGYNIQTNQNNIDNNNKQEENNMSLLFRTLGIVVEDNNNVLDQLNTSYIDKNGRPYADIRIHRAIVIHDPFQCMSNMSNSTTTTTTTTTTTNPFIQLLNKESKQSIDSKILHNYIQNKFQSTSNNNVSKIHGVYDDDNDDNNNTYSDCDIELYSPYVPPEELYYNCRPIEETVSSRISIHDVLDEKKKQQSLTGTNNHNVNTTDNENDDNNDNDDNTNVQQLTAIEMDMIQQADARSREVVLQMIGDIPDSSAMVSVGGNGEDNTNIIIKPPENVLFICKLNSITTDDDLQLIFSRFDTNVIVDIIRDNDTYQSLQYGFIQFTTNEQANEAYIKMNNILIDDRRIHIDFSQSVAKIWDRYNQRLRIITNNTTGTTKNTTTTTSMPRFEKNGDPRTGLKPDNGNTNNNNTNNNKNKKNLQNNQQQQHSGSNYKNNSNSNHLRPQQQQQKQRMDGTSKDSLRHDDSVGSNRRQNKEYNNINNSNNQRTSEHDNKSADRDDYNYHRKGVNRGRYQDNDTERNRFRNNSQRDYDNNNNNRYNNQRNIQLHAPKGDGWAQQYDEYGRKRIDSDRSNSSNNNKNNSKRYEDRNNYNRIDDNVHIQYHHGRHVGNSVGDQNDDRNWREGRGRQQQYESDVQYNRDRSRSRHDDVNISANNNSSYNNNEDRYNRRRNDDDKYLSKSPNRHHHKQHDNDRDSRSKSHSLLESDYRSNKTRNDDRDIIQNNHNDNNNNDVIEDAGRYRYRRESSSRKKSRREEEDFDSDERYDRKERKKERKMKKRKHTGKDDDDNDNYGNDSSSESQSRRKDKKVKKSKEKKRKQHRHSRRRDSSPSSSSSE